MVIGNSSYNYFTMITFSRTIFSSWSVQISFSSWCNWQYSRSSISRQRGYFIFFQRLDVFIPLLLLPSGLFISVCSSLIWIDEQHCKDGRRYRLAWHSLLPFCVLYSNSIVSHFLLFLLSIICSLLALLGGELTALQERNPFTGDINFWVCEWGLVDSDSSDCLFSQHALWFHAELLHVPLHYSQLTSYHNGYW